ncbi:BufA1 family periplasmic bufferin-type metallophore [Legionella bozemanae]|uniref:BufA1 family periplasmic bufferin-type metallophore n=1 Tax=Legionella bozemanae TaxID=447 RepID=UPI00399C8287
MITRDKLMQSVMTAFFVLVATGSSAADNGATAATEKCYGIAKKGMNDCATATASCASSATKDKQKDAFILLPKGLCDRIVGGSLKPE